MKKQWNYLIKLLIISNAFTPNPSEVQCSNLNQSLNLLNHILGYDYFPVWHVGTDYLHEIGKNWYDYLVSKGVEFIWETKVT